MSANAVKALGALKRNASQHHCHTCSYAMYSHSFNWPFAYVLKLYANLCSYFFGYFVYANVWLFIFKKMLNTSWFT